MKNKYVVNCRTDKFDIYIGRPSIWGNPFIIGRDGDRKEVIKKYRDYLFSNPILIEKAKKELRGKVLGCYCAPEACHGDVLAEIANKDGGHNDKNTCRNIK